MVASAHVHFALNEGLDGGMVSTDSVMHELHSGFCASSSRFLGRRWLFGVLSVFRVYDNST